MKILGRLVRKKLTGWGAELCRGNEPSGCLGKGILGQECAWSIQELQGSQCDYFRVSKVGRGGHKSEQCRASLCRLIKALVRIWGFP